MIQRSNSANLHPQRFQEISASIQAQLMGGGQDNLMEEAALEALSPISAFKAVITLHGITEANSENPPVQHFNGHPLRG